MTTQQRQILDSKKGLWFFQPPNVRMRPEDQAVRLRGVFPELRGATYDRRVAETKEGKERPLPPAAETYLVIPRWTLLHPTSYMHACARVLKELRRLRKHTVVQEHAHLLNSAEFFRLCRRTEQRQIQLGKLQEPHKLLVFPAQLGMFYHNCAEVNARVAMDHDEFGLDLFSILITLVTHERALSPKHRLTILCAGTEYHKGTSRPDSTTMYQYLPCITRGEKVIQVNVQLKQHAPKLDSFTGCATAFMPAPILS